MYNRSHKPKNPATTIQIAITVKVYLIVSDLVGQVIFLISDQAPPRKLDTLFSDFIYD